VRRVPPSEAARQRVARNLAREIKARGLTKVDVARMAKISRNTLDMLLHARRSATVDVLARLADALHVDLCKLLA